MERDLAITETRMADWTLDAVVWVAPIGWTAPTWLEPEPCPPGLPMNKDRFRWCLHVLGWSMEETGRRLYTDSNSIRRMARNIMPIPDTLALWLEYLAAGMLSEPPLPAAWRRRG